MATWQNTPGAGFYAGHQGSDFLSKLYIFFIMIHYIFNMQQSS